MNVRGIRLMKGNKRLAVDIFTILAYTFLNTSICDDSMNFLGSHIYELNIS